VNKIEVLERMAYGFRSRANYVARVLLVCSGTRQRCHRHPDSCHDLSDQFRAQASPDFAKNPTICSAG